MISEERLQEAAKAVSRAMLDGLPEPEDCQHDFSPEFERKMNKLLRKNGHPWLSRGLKRVACIILVFFLCGGTFLTVNAEARGIVFGWVGQRLGIDQRYSFSGHSGQEREDISYYLPEVPEGYEFLETEDSVNGWTTLYSNEDDEYLDFGYFREPPENSAMALYFAVNDMERSTLRIHDMSAEYYEDDTGEIANLIVWIDSETNTLFYITGYFDKDQLVELAESVTAEEK